MMKGVEDFLLKVFAIASFICLVNAEIVNQKVERTVDVTSQLVKTQIKVTAKDDKPMKEYNFQLPAFEYARVAFISASVNSENDVKIREEPKFNRFVFIFNKAQPIQTFRVTLVIAHNQRAHPEEIRQSEKQFIQYDGYLYYYTSYHTITQTVTVKLSSSNILSYTQFKPFTLTGNKIKYGPHENVEGFNHLRITFHYENENPFLTVTDLEREIELSHWGNIAIKENINLYHSGAKLKGSFSRYEYQKDTRSGLSSVKQYKTLLPPTAHSVYYRDTNGNISTSNMRYLSDAVELELRPRFPLFGGWKTQYILGYSVPAYDYLFNKGDKYLLKMKIVDHIFDDMYIKRATIKVILPEGATNIKLTTPYKVDRRPDSLHYTYLDTIGRPVVSFFKKSLVENHISDLEISYDFKKTSLLQEPLLLIGFIYIIFILTIICSRLDFSLSTSLTPATTATTPHQHKD